MCRVTARTPLGRSRTLMSAREKGPLDKGGPRLVPRALGSPCTISHESTWIPLKKQLKNTVRCTKTSTLQAGTDGQVRRPGACSKDEERPHPRAARAGPPGFAEARRSGRGLSTQARAGARCSPPCCPRAVRGAPVTACPCSWDAGRAKVNLYTRPEGRRAHGPLVSTLQQVTPLVGWPPEHGEKG